jgi:hypothetical protein
MVTASEPQGNRTETAHRQINAGKINGELMSRFLGQIDPATEKKIEVSKENKSKLQKALMEVDEQFGDKLSAEEITKKKMKVLMKFAEEIYVEKKLWEHISKKIPQLNDKLAQEVLNDAVKIAYKETYTSVKKDLTDFLMNLLDSLKPYWEKIKDFFKPKKMVENSVKSVMETFKEQNLEAYRKAMIEQANSNTNNLNPTDLSPINAGGSF